MRDGFFEEVEDGIGNVVERGLGGSRRNGAWMSARAVVRPMRNGRPVRTRTADLVRVKDAL
jgi:hypothetical protein